MLKIKPPDYQFCPYCQGSLRTKSDDGRLRKHCSLCDWVYYPQVFYSVAAVIIKNGKALLVKRNRQPYKDDWMFPGGFIEYEEHPLETLAKETREETGLKVVRSSLIEIVQTNDDPRAPGNMVFFYQVKVSGKNLKTDARENSDIAWFDLQKLPKITWKSHQAIARLISQKVSRE